MPQTKEQLIAGLKQAIMTEQTGVQFYTIAADKTQDPKGREVFGQLAREEAEHQQWLLRQFGHLMAGESFEALKPVHYADFSGPSPVFSDELKNRLGQAHWEMTALSVGLTLEDATIAHYRMLAQAAAEPAVRAFFEELTRWEEGHAEALRRQSTLLLESYWHEAHFAPF
jgi:rubrerythrin